MKKLTAGIFATILGVTAMGAASAAMPEGFTSVATTNYVKEAVGAAKTEVSNNYATKQALTDEVTARTNADTTLQSNINTLAQDTTNSLNLKADKAEVGTLPEGTSATTVVEYVDLKTKDIASSDTVTGLTTRVKTIEDDYITTQKLTDSQNAQNTAITTAYQAADATTLQAAKDYADTKVYNDTQVKADILANTQAIDAIEADYLKADDIANMATTSYVETATNGMATQTWVEGKNYVSETALTAKDYATKTEAQGYADAKDTAIADAKKAGTDAAAAAATADGKAVAAQTDATKALGDAAAAKTAADNAQSEVDALENVVAGKADASALGSYVLWTDVDNSYNDDAAI